MRKRSYKYIHALAAIALGLALASVRQFAGSPVKMAQADDLFYVARVVDGDTLKLSDGRKVRLIGIDTPELHYGSKLLKDAKKADEDIATIQELGKRAASFLTKLVKGKRVRLEHDVVSHDRYERTLAYVYLEDGTFVNAKVIEEGYGQAMTVPPNVRHADYFVRLQKVARENNKGLWGLDSYRKLR